MECVIELEGGKYTYVSHDDGRQYALRHGEHWRDFIGDKFVYCMASEVAELRLQNAALRTALKKVADGAYSDGPNIAHAALAEIK